MYKILLFSLALLHIEAVMAAFQVTSASFSHGTAINAKYSCNGISPHMSLKNIPVNTKTLVLVIDDPDAQAVVGHTFLHFAGQYKLTDTSIPEGQLSAMATKTINNDSGKPGYRGPCPPKGPAHHYYFTWIAFDKTIDIAPYNTNQFRNTYNKTSEFYTKNQKNIIGTAQVMGTFKQ